MFWTKMWNFYAATSHTLSHSTQVQSTASHCQLTSPTGEWLFAEAQQSPLAGCQVTSRPLDRFSRYSKWLDTLLTGLVYRVSQEECEILRESVPCVKLYPYNPKHLYPKLNGYGVNGHRKVWASVVSTNCTPSVTPYSSTAQARQRDIVMQWPWRRLYSTVALTSQDNERSGGLHKVLRSLRTTETWMREFL